MEMNRQTRGRARLQLSFVVPRYPMSHARSMAGDPSLRSDSKSYSSIAGDAQEPRLSIRFQGQKPRCGLFLLPCYHHLWGCICWSSTDMFLNLRAQSWGSKSCVLHLAKVVVRSLRCACVKIRTVLPCTSSPNNIWKNRSRMCSVFGHVWSYVGILMK